MVGELVAGESGAAQAREHASRATTRQTRAFAAPHITSSHVKAANVAERRSMRGQVRSVRRSKKTRAQLVVRSRDPASAPEQGSDTSCAAPCSHTPRSDVHDEDEPIREEPTGRVRQRNIGIRPRLADPREAHVDVLVEVVEELHGAVRGGVGNHGATLVHE